MLRLIFVYFLVFLCLSAFAQTEVMREKHFNLQNKIALSEYDAVSYFNGKPHKGRKDQSFSYQGVTYYFSSPGNLNSFKANPLKYEPAYGGWCAYAMGSDGSKVEVDPETFKIINGKLYLFYNFYFNNTLKKWNSGEIALKAKADKNWNDLINR